MNQPLFGNDSPGALTLEQAQEIAVRQAREQRRQAAQRRREAELRAAGMEAEDDFTFPEGGFLAGFNPYRARKAAEVLAAQGRGDDTELAHLAPYEIVLPTSLQTPKVLEAIREAAETQDVALGQLLVGSAGNSINPNTGLPEFGFLDTLNQWKNHVIDDAKDVASWTLGRIAEPFENDGSGTGVVRPPMAVTAPLAAPTNQDLGYNPNDPGLWPVLKTDPVGMGAAFWHGERARQEARDRYEGGPAEATLQGGEADAWRHARWNQRMTDAIGPERAKIFADYNEQSNASPAGDRAMDLYNNQVGRMLVGDRTKSSIDDLVRSSRLRLKPY